MEELGRNIETILTEYTARWGIVIVNQTTGERLELHPERVFPAASMIKVPIMYEIMRQAAAGAISLDSCLKATPSFRAGGAGVLKELRPDIEMTVRELVTLMIILSDNTATNMLIDLAGMDGINRTIRDLGLKSTVLRRRMMDFAAALAGKENETSAADMALMFTIIYDSGDLPASYGALMLDILKRQQIRDKLPFFLPEDTILAHKTGTLTGIEHDGGVLFLPGGPYIAVVLTGGHDANYRGLQLVARIGQAIYEYAGK